MTATEVTLGVGQFTAYPTGYYKACYDTRRPIKHHVMPRDG